MRVPVLLACCAIACAPARNADARDVASNDLPQRLSETGLFATGAASQVRADLLSFSPQYPLWSDGATKRRWLYLPPGATVDGSNPDAWEFPIGAKLWKEFSYGRRVETRFIERQSNGAWRYASYLWNEAGDEATLAPAEGVASWPARSAPQGRYAAPSREDCRACHEGGATPVLGFSALQLSPDRDPNAPHAEAPSETDVDLQKLLERGLIRNLPRSYRERAPRVQAQTPTARAALGYLHGNCAHCHNRVGSLAPLELNLAQATATSASNDVLRSLVGARSEFRLEPVTLRVAPGDPNASVLLLRMRSRDPLVQMPPLGAQVADSAALTLIERWIRNDLDPPPEIKP